MKSSSMPERLRVLVDAYCTDSLESSDLNELEALLSDDAEARRYFSAYCRMHAELFFAVEAAHAVQAVRAPVCAPTPEPTGSSLFGNAWNGAFGFLSQTGPLSYLVATLLFALGMWFGSQITISRSIDRDRYVDADRTDQLDKLPVPNAVACITALADCRWHKTGSGVRDQGSGISNLQNQRSKAVFLGDRIAVVSGLMELTYDSGARVILEGPCRYQVDSPRGGFLAVGKLTARVEANDGRRGMRAATPQSLIPNSLFAIRTPMATVIDLGTEFGVEVDGSGATRSHVFQGSVELRPSNSRKPTSPGEPGEILSAGESARVERGRNNRVLIRREEGQSERYVRHMNSGERGKRQKKSVGLAANHNSKGIDQSPSSRHYRLIDLGALGGTGSRAFAINNLGQVVGEAATAQGSVHAFLYADGKMTDLGAPPDGQSRAYGINALGQVVGVGISGFDEGVSHAFIYADGVTRDIGTLGGRTARALSINDAGTIVGASENSHGVEHAFLCCQGKPMKDLGSLGGPEAASWARDINYSGMVIGCTETNDRRIHAFIYSQDTGMRALGDLTVSRSVAQGINNAGQVVGFTFKDNDAARAFIYSANSGMKDLGTLGGPVSRAVDINRRGQVIGNADGVDSRGNGYNHTFLYRGGRMIDLNSLVYAAVGWTNLNVMSINDVGQIVGYGTAPDETIRAFLLTPISKD